MILKVNGNAVRVTQADLADAAALSPGAPIGQNQLFQSANGSSYGGVNIAAAGMYTRSYSNGPWGNTRNHYLGLKFRINGQVHYGWARLNVPHQFEDGGVVLTGYAYEDSPNRPIRAGQTSGGDAPGEANLPVPQRESPTLGDLAMGNRGLEIWWRN